MRSPATDILETALALHRAPGERFRLRGRPLSPATIRLIEIAAGGPQALREAAGEVGEPEQSVLEAARFYLEQMLFADPGADAYRVLGVAPDAPTDEIRRHHRLLQRWLHPDRAGAGDAAVFATRVNQAWSQLRTPEARQAYDARLAAAGAAGAGAGEAVAAAPVRIWAGEAEAPPVGRRSRWLLGAALAACAVLVFLVYRNEQRPARAADFATVEAAPVAVVPAPAGDAGAGHDPALQRALARALEPAVDVLPRDPGDAPIAPAPATSPPPPAPLLPFPEPAPVMASAPAAARPVAAAPAGAGSAAAPVAAVRAAPLPAARRPAAAPAEATPVVAAAAPTSAGAANLVAASVAPANPGPVSPAPAKPAPAIPAPASPAPAIAAAAPPPPAAPTMEQILATRMRAAELRLGQVTAYLASAPDAAPLWNDAGVADRAARLRQRFDRRVDCPEFDAGVWRLHRDNARATAAWRCRSERGRLEVELVWREGMWLVRGLDMAPAA